jgi:hypothetical protein
MKHAQCNETEYFMLSKIENLSVCNTDHKLRDRF